jgi:hypothetical protein
MGGRQPGQATRKGWPYYIRHAPSTSATSRPYIVGPPLAGGLPGRPARAAGLCGGWPARAAGCPGPPLAGGLCRARTPPGHPLPLACVGACPGGWLPLPLACRALAPASGNASGATPCRWPAGRGRNGSLAPCSGGTVIYPITCEPMMTDLAFCVVLAALASQAATKALKTRDQTVSCR